VILVAILAFPITARTQEAASCVQPSPGNAQKCARIALAQQFVRELEIIYRLQEAVKQELAEDSSGPGKLATSIKVRTRMLFEMNDSINRLSMINVDAKWAEFRDALKKLHHEPPGMELSAGSSVGADAWEIPATELDYAWIAPPQGFVGTVKLIAKLRLPDNHIADRQAIDVAWQSPISRAPALAQLQESAALQAVSSDPVQIQHDRDQTVSSQPLVTAGEEFDGEEVALVPSIVSAPVHQGDQQEVLPSKLSASTLRQIDSNEIGSMPEPIQLIPNRDQIVPADPSPPALQRRLDGEEITLLLKRGKDLIASGDLAAARLVLQRAADANHAEAALALGATYDPLVLRELKVYGFTPDAAMARVWYEKAIKLGSPAAPRRLEMLTQGTATR
jgi:hypothetical protein